MNQAATALKHVSPKTNLPVFGLRARFLTIVIAALIPALILVFYNAAEQRKQAAAGISNYALQLAKDVAGQQQALIESARQFAQSLSYLPEVQELIADECSLTLAELLKGFTGVVNVLVATPNGDVVCSAVEFKVPVNVADRTYFQDATSTRNVSVSGYLVGRVVNRPVITINLPTFDTSRTLRSVIVVAVSLAWTNELLARQGMPPGSTATIIDRKGVVLAHFPDSQRQIGKVLTEIEIAWQEQEIQREMLEATGADGVRRIHWITPIRGEWEAPTGFVSLGIPKSMAFADIDARYRRNLAVLVFVGIAVALICWITATMWVGRPVRALLQSTSRLASGDQSVRAGPPYSGGELGRLARAFDDLADAVESRDRDLRENRKLLDAIVNSLPLAISLKNREGRYVFVNRYLEKFIGKPVAEILGKTHVDIYGPLLGGEYKAMHDQIQESGQPIINMEEQLTDADGTESVWLVDKVPLKDEAGQVTGVMTLSLDITDRKRSEQAVEDSQALMRALIDHSPNKVHVKDVNGQYLLINQRAQKLFRVTEEEGRNKTATDIFTPSKAVRFAEHDREVMKSGKAIEREEEFDLDDGVHTYLTTKFPVYNASGELRGIGAIGADITERKRAESALRDREKQLQHITDGLPVMIVQFDTNLRYQFANKTAEAWYGRPRTEIVGKHVSEILGDTVFKSLEPFYAKVLTGKRLTADLTTPFPDGVTREITVDYIPNFDPQGGIVGFYAMIMDISDRKRAETALDESRKLLATILDELPICVSVKDTEGRYLLMNRFEADKVDRPAEEVIGKTVADVYGEERGQTLEKLDRRVLDSGEPMPYFEYQVENADATKSFWLTSKTPLINPQGRVQGVISIGLDITDRKLAEVKLQRAQKFDAIGQLTSGIAHDFNNLLTIILGNLQLLERALADNPKQQKKASVAIDAATRGANLTGRLLAFARKQVLEPGAVDLSSLITGMMELISRSLGITISINLKLDEEVWPIWVDTGQLENVILNLAVNSRDAMPDGGEVFITTGNQTVDEEYAATHTGLLAGDYVTMEISDTGCGMDTETTAHAFDPFFTTKDVGKGTGLGLATVYGFVKQSGGYVSLYSELGHGTTVRLYFPRSKRAESEAPSPADVPKSVPRGTETILVCEDEPGVREVGTAMLEDLGYRVLSATNGQEALNLLANQNGVDLLFTDVVMRGGMNGAQLVDAARSQRPKLKVVVASGFANDLLNHRNQSLRGTHFIQKPYRRGKLARIIRKALDE